MRRPRYGSASTCETPVTSPAAAIAPGCSAPSPTYAPSNSGEKDLSGSKIPFQDNSTKSGNFILWYQDDHFQARVAYNYRSRRAVMDSVGGITGMEMYEAPQRYVDASVSYKFSKYAEVFLDGTNLTNEYQKYYLVWPDQPGHSTYSERMFMLGVRGQW